MLIELLQPMPLGAVRLPAGARKHVPPLLGRRLIAKGVAAEVSADGSLSRHEPDEEEKPKAPKKRAKRKQKADDSESHAEE